MFKVTILSQKKTIFEGKAQTVFLPGAEGEFEVMTFHKPLLSLLRAGRIIIDNRQTVAISVGIVRVLNNELVALVEE